MKVINARDLIVGRLATYCAKQALLGEEISIINCKEAVLTGDTKMVLKRFKEKRTMGDAFKGPFQPRRADRIVKRSVRGMLPYKKPRGSEALKRIKCYVNVPEGLDESKSISLDQANIKNSKSLKYVYLKQVSKSVGIQHE